MLVLAFRALSQQLAVIFVIVMGCAALVWVVNSYAAALALLEISVARMKAPWVWTFGYGLAAFVSRAGRLLPAALDGILVPSEVTAAALSRIDRATRHRNALRYTVPLTGLGVVLTAFYGIPLHGLAYALVFVGVCAIYYVAGFLLFHFVEVTLAFHHLLEGMDTVEFRRLYSPLHLENVTTYLALTTALGLVGIYAGFRGTLTAGFEFPQEVWRTFLATPVVLFLPGTLLYNYYPRYVLRKILQHRVFQTIERLGVSDETDARKLVLDLKESIVLSSQMLPFLDYKSLPSYLIAILFVLSLAYSNDPAVRAFVSYLVRFGSP
jgi:hypothetical protein